MIRQGRTVDVWYRASGDVLPRSNGRIGPDRVVISYGDGRQETVQRTGGVCLDDAELVSYAEQGQAQHEYAEPGTYEVRVTVHYCGRGGQSLTSSGKADVTIP